ncbi:MAG: hypothetical protein KGI62_09685 [Xanthomonadaceae bacterium]|nr:hypothetical protein [Xanthomonadaceae bacterium]
MFGIDQKGRRLGCKPSDHLRESWALQSGLQNRQFLDGGLPGTMTRPFVNYASSRTCVITSQPALSGPQIAGVVNLVRMSVSDNAFLFIGRKRASFSKSPARRPLARSYKVSASSHARQVSGTSNMPDTGFRPAPE